jgi:hypothetical protein
MEDNKSLLQIYATIYEKNSITDHRHEDAPLGADGKLQPKGLGDERMKLLLTQV